MAPATPVVATASPEQLGEPARSPKRTRHPIASMHVDDQADALLTLRRQGYGTCAQLAALTGLSVADIEQALVRCVGMLVSMGFPEAAICAEYNFTADQVRECVRRTGAKPQTARNPATASPRYPRENNQLPLGKISVP
jgi:hypothetical protein